MKLHGRETTYERTNEFKFGVDWSRDQTEYMLCVSSDNREVNKRNQNV